MEVIKLNKKTGEETTDVMNSEAIKKYGERLTFVAWLFFCQTGVSSFAKWIHGLSMKTEDWFESEDAKDLAYKVTCSGGVLCYENEEYVWTAKMSE